MSDPFLYPHDPGIAPWWLRDATPAELAKHRRLTSQLHLAETHNARPVFQGPHAGGPRSVEQSPQGAFALTKASTKDLR